MKQKQRSTQYSLADFINKTKYIFISILALVIVGGASYAIFQRITTTSLNEARVVIEALEERYTELFEEYPLHETHVELPEEEITSLIEELDEITATYKKSFTTQESYFKKGNLYLLKKDYESANAEFENSLEHYKSEVLVTKTLAILAAIAEEQEFLDKAIVYLTRITDNYPRSIETAHAMFNLGRISEALDKKNDAATAQGFYLALLDNDLWQESPWTSLAKSRLAILGYTNIVEEQTEGHEDSE